MWLEPLLWKTIDVKVLPTKIENNFITPLKQYITNAILPDDLMAGRKTRINTTRYMMMRDDLYRIMGDWPLLKCVSKDDGAYFLWEMYEGICGAHIGVSTLVRKVMCYGYFWPTMREVAKEIVRASHKWKIHDNNHYVPKNEYHSMSTLIPFIQYGDGSFRTIPKSKRREGVLSSGSGFFHEMDWSQSTAVSLLNKSRICNRRI